jgi:methyltransferase
MCRSFSVPHPDMATTAMALFAVLVMMLAELMRSRRNERELRCRGAVEPRGDVYRALAFVYPLMFVAMAIEGSFFARISDWLLIGGFLLFVASKALKLWAISSLSQRWSYRVLVLPGAPLVDTGPYAHLRHPNYLAVFGEIAGFAMMVGAFWTGIGSLLLFGVLVRRRIAIEENALEAAQAGGLPSTSKAYDPGHRMPEARSPEPGA